MKFSALLLSKLLMALGLLVAFFPFALLLAGDWIIRHGIGGIVVVIVAFAYLVPLGGLLFALGLLIRFVRYLRKKKK